MIGIYQILDKNTNKSYIGQSRDIHTRLLAHQREILSGEHTIPKENYEFLDFIILEETTLDMLNEAEKFWIKYFRSYEDGYNKTMGGGAAVSPWLKNTDRAKEIIFLLKETSLDFKEIAKEKNVHPSTVSRINSGLTNYFAEEKYPIRRINKVEKNYCVDCFIEISSNSTRCADCWHTKQRIVERPSKDELLDILLDNPNFSAVGRDFSVSDNAIRKWCKFYDLPTSTKYYKPKKIKRKVTSGEVLQIDLKTQEVIKKFPSAIAAARALGNEDYNKHISSVCSGNRKSAYGYYWKRVKL